MRRYRIFNGIAAMFAASIGVSLCVMATVDGLPIGYFFALIDFVLAFWNIGLFFRWDERRASQEGKS